MAIPILVIKVNLKAVDPIGKLTHIEVQKAMEKKFHDYHVLVIPVVETPNDISIDVYHEKDFTEVQHQELLKIVTDSIEKPDA